jgi:hypothetical protein
LSQILSKTPLKGKKQSNATEINRFLSHYFLYLQTKCNFAVDYGEFLLLQGGI